MAYFRLQLLTVALLALQLAACQSSFNPSILQDSRDLPQVDGTFGFLYRTEDGIAHAAKGDSNGQIHGRFSYTDPTGLKVNYNYNAGSRVTPGYDYDAQSTPRQYNSPRQYSEAPVTEQYREPPRRQQYAPAPQPQYEEPDQRQYEQPAQRQYEPPQQSQHRYRPQSRPQYSAQYREPAPQNYQRRTRPSYNRQNEVSEDYY